MDDPSTMTEDQFAAEIQTQLLALLGKTPTREEVTEGALAVAKPYIAALSNNGTFWIGDGLFRLGQPASGRGGRSVSIVFEEVPTFAVTITVDPNRTTEG